TSRCRKNREQVPAERDFACPDGSGMAASKVFRSADWSGCKQEHAMELQFISPQQLRPTEEYDSDAALVLSRQIARDGFWRVALLVHRRYLAIRDGPLRWQAAIHMRLAMMPCFVCSYAEDNIQLGTWRADFCPTVGDVFRAAGTGRLFPRKTTRHQFPKLNLNFVIPLDLLVDHA